ncbi:hypothetical protein [Rhodopirellula europaea]|uniref:hypothetical protein n=1 Tax=Rhodopirellula europaea TaxID=1263866 RepID=UPI003D29A307|tara:strand:+ start:12082 stop:12870 length:789 start_codon:yes stop_codon:yes gene_type:complete
MLRALKVKLVVTSLAVAVGVTGSASSALGQEHAGHHAANKVVVDADILSAFVNKPCENFQLARKHFLSGNNKKAASSLRTALAFLRLEAARADAISQVAIEKSVNDLKLLASAVERGEVQAYSELQRAFVEAHVALASHHCVQSDTCCCQLEKDGADGDVTCVCRELNAATIHLEQATMWRNGKLAELVQPTYDESHFAEMESMGFSNSMATHKKDANQNRFLSNMKQRIGSLHQKLEAFTGRKIQLARPHEIDAFGGMDLR